MTRKTLCLLKPLAAFAALGALAAGCANPEPARVAGAEGEVTCQEVRQPGSNVLRRLCLTDAQWREYQASSRRGAQEFLRRASQAGAAVSEE